MWHAVTTKLVSKTQIAATPLLMEATAALDTAVDGVEVIEGGVASPRSRSSRTPRGIAKKGRAGQLNVRPSPFSYSISL